MHGAEPGKMSKTVCAVSSTVSPGRSLAVAVWLGMDLMPYLPSSHSALFGSIINFLGEGIWERQLTQHSPRCELLLTGHPNLFILISI